MNFAAHARFHAEKGDWESAIQLLGDAIDWLAFGFGADPTQSDPDAAVCPHCCFELAAAAAEQSEG